MTKKKKTPYQAHMSRELKGKMTGKTKSQRIAMFKAAAKSWKKKSKSPKASGSKSKSGRMTRIRSTASSGGSSKVGKKGGFNLQKIYSLVRMGALAVPGLIVATTPGLTPRQKLERGFTKYTGWHFQKKKFVWEELMEGYGPLVGASIGTIVIPKIISMIRRL